MKLGWKKQISDYPESEPAWVKIVQDADEPLRGSYLEYSSLGSMIKDVSSSMLDLQNQRTVFS
jgi:hypothetical protein